MEAEENSAVIDNMLYVISKTENFICTNYNILIIFFHMESYPNL